MESRMMKRDVWTAPDIDWRSAPFCKYGKWESGGFAKVVGFVVHCDGVGLDLRCCVARSCVVQISNGRRARSQRSEVTLPVLIGVVGTLISTQRQAHNRAFFRKKKQQRKEIQFM